MRFCPDIELHSLVPDLCQAVVLRDNGADASCVPVLDPNDQLTPEKSSAPVPLHLFPPFLELVSTV